MSNNIIQLAQSRKKKKLMQNIFDHHEVEPGKYTTYIALLVSWNIGVDRSMISSNKGIVGSQTKRLIKNCFKRPPF